jgi:hypothetical protein
MLSTDQERLRDAICWAVENGYLRILKEISATGQFKDYDKCNEDEKKIYSAELFVSCGWNNKIDILKYLIEEKKCTEPKYLVNAMHSATKYDYLDIVKYLTTKYKTSIDYKYYNCFETAIYNGSLSIVKYFIEECKYEFDKEDHGLLIKAISSMKLDIVKYLVKIGVSLKDKDNKCLILFHAAEKYYQNNSIEYLNILKYLTDLVYCKENNEYKKIDDDFDIRL